MTTSSYLKRPLRKYEDALVDVEKIRAAEARSTAKAKQKKQHAKLRQRPAA